MINNRDKVVLKKFGEHLRRIRIGQGLSQQELALKAGISKNQIGNIERGEVNITLSTAYLIAITLKVDLDELFKFPLKG